MIRLVIVAILLGSCFLLAASSSTQYPVSSSGAIPAASPEKCVSCKKPDTDKPNALPNVTDVAFDKDELRLPCSESSLQASPREMTIEVATTAEDADNDVLTYVYTISGGRIVGTGKKVFWNLAGTRAGTYSIVAGVDDGCGVCGRTVSKTITVHECGP